MKSFELHQLRVEMIGEDTIQVTQPEPMLDPEPSIFLHVDQVEYLAAQLRLAHGDKSSPVDDQLSRRRLSHLCCRIIDLADASADESAQDVAGAFRQTSLKLSALAMLAEEYLQELGLTASGRSMEVDGCQDSHSDRTE